MTESTWSFTDFSIPLSTIIGYPEAEEPKSSSRIAVRAHSLTSRASSKGLAGSRASKTGAWPEDNSGLRRQRKTNKVAAAHKNEARLQGAPFAHDGGVNTAGSARPGRKASHLAHAPVTRRKQGNAVETDFTAAANRNGSTQDSLPSGVRAQPTERREHGPSTKTIGIPQVPSRLPRNSRSCSMPATSRQLAYEQNPSENHSRAPVNTAPVQSGGDSSSQSEEEDDDDVQGIQADPPVVQQSSKLTSDQVTSDKDAPGGGNTSRLRRMVGLRRLKAAVAPLGFSRSRQPVAAPPKNEAASTAIAGAAVPPAGKRPSANNVPAEASRSRFNPWGGGGGRPAAWQAKPNSDAGEEEDDEEGKAAAALLRSAEAWDYTSRPEVDKRDLVADSTLDERHPRRLVKCVTWQPPSMSRGASSSRNSSHQHQGNVSRSINGQDQPSRGRSSGRNHQQQPPRGRGKSQQRPPPMEKFALKITMRGPKDVHCKRVFTEKDIMLALEPSPWHIKLESSFKTEANLYMLLPYEPNLSVDLKLEWGRGLRHGGLPLARFYTACALLAIEHMHHRGVVHRDIKPGNMLVDGLGYVKICDYGLAKFLPLGGRTSTFLGTLAYMPPEAIASEPYDHGTDLWGLAISLFEMLFGSTPFEPNSLLSEQEWRNATKQNILGGNLRFPYSNARATLPARLFLKSMLDIRPEDRLHAPNLAHHKVRKHALFSTIDWTALSRRTLDLPHAAASSNMSPRSVGSLGTEV